MKRCYYCMTEIESDRKSTCPHCGKKLDDKRQSERFLQPGTTLYGKFIVGHPIGSGGFGNTYIGWDQLLLRKVAIKEYYPEQFCFRAKDGVTITNNGGKYEARFRKGVQQFLEEARNVAALQDIKGVVKIANFFEANGTGYIAMEYLEGMDVGTILKKDGNKKEYEWSRRVILTVLFTLREIHKRGVLHRDIAPDNIFVTNEGVIKLIDFGAAKSATEVENSGDIFLKKGYSPIEQYSRRIPQGPYTDLYGVAGMFYRMLTGQRPIPANERAIKDGLIAPSDMGIKLPAQAEAAIMICLSVDPKYRLQSADEFMEALNGKNFIPVYEPEWILPKIKKDSFGKKMKDLPLSAKIALGAMVVCIAVGAGLGTYAYRQSSTAGVVTDGSSAIVPSFVGKTYEEAENELKEFNRQYGMGLTLEEEAVSYTRETDQNGVVKEQSVPVGTDLSEADTVNSLNLTYGENGKIEGTIYCTCYSSDYISYSELSDKNAYEISVILGMDITGDTFKKVDSEKAEDKAYWSLKNISLDTGDTIKASDLKNDENASKTIEVSKISQIAYYGASFFYWKSIPNFQEEYGTKEKLMDTSFKTYTYSDESTRKAGKKKKLTDNLFDEEYYSVSSKYPAGTIIGQSIDPGKTYDGSTDAELKIKIIGTMFEKKGTANQVKEEIEKVLPPDQYEDIKVEVSEGNNSVSSIEVKDSEGKSVEYFGKSDKVTIKITGAKKKSSSKKSSKKKSSKKKSSKKKSSKKKK